jgi:hypothetical protein
MSNYQEDQPMTAADKFDAAYKAAMTRPKEELAKKVAGRVDPACAAAEPKSTLAAEVAERSLTPSERRELRA